MEVRIFDFDRRCGSHTRRVSCVFVFVYAFTLSLFNKRDRVAVPRSHPVFSFIHCAVKSSQAQVNLYCFLVERGLAQDLVHVLISPFFTPGTKSRLRVLLSLCPRPL